jgi:hypothetical protein
MVHAMKDNTATTHGTPQFDLGHRDDVDRTLIVQSLSLTPDKRLARHEGWRLFVKEAHARAGIHQGNHPSADSSSG